MVSGAGVASATGALGSNTKLVGYREGSHLSSLGSESPHRCVWETRQGAWPQAHDGIVARSGQHCLGSVWPRGHRSER